MSMERFLANQVTAESIMVRPEKWNQAEYDGLNIHMNEIGERKLVAWNASEACRHSGNVTKLTLFLRLIGNREENPVRFDKVRFVFIIPTANLESFQLPNAQATLMARNQLVDARFTGFEKMRAIPTRSAVYY